MACNCRDVMEEDKNNKISDSRIGTYGTLVATIGS
jgi:hypothetical protein